MKILAIHPFITGDRINPFAGGKNRAAFLLSYWLAKEGHKVAILPWHERLGQDCWFQLGDGAVARVLATTGIARTRDYVRFGLQFARKNRRRWSGGVRSVVMLRRAIETFKPDIIHVHYTISTFPEIYQTMGKPVPIVLTHTHEVGNALDTYDMVVFPSEFQRSTVVDKKLVPSDRTRVIYYPVDEVFLQNKTSQPRDILTFVGLLKERKRLDILLEAYRLTPELSSYRLHVCGDGPLRGAYEAFTREHNLNVVFHGKLSAPAVRDLLMRSVLMVVPSRNESFGIVYAESLCCGTPFIGYPQTVDELEKSWGMRVGLAYDAASNDARALATLIQRAGEDKVVTQSHREALMEKAKTQFTLERYGTEYLACYSEVLRGKRAG